MPPVVVAAGITAAGALGGAALASRSTNKATSAQQKANEASLAYTREKDAQTRADTMYREGLWQKQYNDWNNARNQLLQRYGFEGSFAPLSGYGTPTPMGSGQMPGNQAGAVPRAGMRRPSPYADLIPERAEDSPGTQEIMAGDPTDWRRYGLE